jgi:CheY-like chemotaxis protein
VIFISQQKFSFLLDGMEKRGLRAFFKHFAHVNKNKTLLLKNNYPLTLTHPVKRSFLYTDTILRTNNTQLGSKAIDGVIMKTLLLADDEANLRMLARITLDDPDYRILEAADGKAALTLARTEHPDLLVLDWMMPGLTGIEVAHLLRQDPNTSDIPIIMLTAKGQEVDKEQGQGYGTYAYLAKPFSPLELLEKVEAALQ